MASREFLPREQGGSNAYHADAIPKKRHTKSLFDTVDPSHDPNQPIRHRFGDDTKAVAEQWEAAKREKEHRLVTIRQLQEQLQTVPSDDLVAQFYNALDELGDSETLEFQLSVAHSYLTGAVEENEQTDAMEARFWLNKAAWEWLDKLEESKAKSKVNKQKWTECFDRIQQTMDWLNAGTGEKKDAYILRMDELKTMVEGILKAPNNSNDADVDAAMQK